MQHTEGGLDTSMRNVDKQFPHKWPDCQAVPFGGIPDLYIHMKAH